MSIDSPGHRSISQHELGIVMAEPRKKRIVTYLQIARLSTLVGVITIVPMVIIGIYLSITRGEWVLLAFGVIGVLGLIAYVMDSEHHFRDDP